MEVTLVRPEQPENAESPMKVTLVPMVTLVRPEQLENAKEPISVTLLGITYIRIFPVGNLMREVWVLLKRIPSLLL